MKSGLVCLLFGHVELITYNGKIYYCVLFENGLLFGECNDEKALNYKILPILVGTS